MTREQAINYLYSSGMSEQQVNSVVSALSTDTGKEQTNDRTGQDSEDLCTRRKVTR